MKTRWLALAALMLTMLFGTSSLAASAADPLTLDAGYVTDAAGVLTDAQKSTVETRLQELSQASSSDLFVVFVDRFTSPSSSTAWADTVAQQNNLGPTQYLLAVAVEGRSYYISSPMGAALSDAKLDEVEDRIMPLAAAQDWEGMVVRAADEIQGDGGAGAMRTFLVIAAIVLIALLAWLIVSRVRRARRAAEIRRRGAMPEKPDPNDPFSTLTDDQVQAQAGSALVRADDAITSSREELGFAVAQFGAAATAEFSGAVEAAGAKMDEAFALRQKLDDEIEDTVQERRAWHIRIIQLCEEIDEVLESNTEAFAALRKLEQNAAQELERVRGERARLQSLLPEAAPALAALAATYDASALSTVADNPAQAAERATLADRSIDAAAQAIGAGRSGEAAFAIRTAEQSVAQAGQLVRAVTALGAELAQIETKAQALVSELHNDVAAAQQLPDANGTIAAAVAATTSQLQQAQAYLAAASRSPQRALDALLAANTQIDAAIAQGREAVERARRVQQVLEQTLAQASSEIRATHDFIETRRGSVGPTARTRLSQADAALTQALGLRSTDPEAALTAARTALDLARQATASAQADVSAYSPYNSGYGNGGWGGNPYSGSGGGSGIGGDILGGIIGGLIAGGGSSGGSGWRSSGWRSSGGYRSSGFGGGGRTSRPGGGLGGGSGGRSGRSGGRRF